MYQVIKRLIPKKIKEKIKSYCYKIKFKKYKKYCIKHNQKEYVLFGVPVHGNLGDQAIVIAECKMLEDCGIKAFEVTTYEQNYIYDYVLKNIEKDALILITGGGNIGSQWLIEENFITKIIKDYREYKIIIFPQTIYYKDDKEGIKQRNIAEEIYSKAKNLYLYTREEKSYEQAKQIFPTANNLLVPDIVLYIDYNNKDYIRDDVILMCIRHDVESNMNEKTKKNIENVARKFSKNIKYTDTVIEKKITANNRNKEVELKLEQFSKSKLVITDRLHGMIFAAITRTPCIAIGNYNHKIKGVYKWINECNFIKYMDKVEKTLLEQKITDIININNKKYNIETNELFKQIKSII